MTISSVEASTLASLPVDDWQFWVVTIIALLALYLVAMPFLPRAGAAKGCGNCPSGEVSERQRTRNSSVKLTIGASDDRAN